MGQNKNLSRFEINVIDSLINDFCKVMEVDKKIFMTCRKQKNSFARQYCQFILRTEFQIPSTKIAGIFNVDHTTVLFNVKKMKTFVNIIPKLQRVWQKTGEML